MAERTQNTQSPHIDRCCYYIRYSANNWAIKIGKSIKPICDCGEIEKSFQAHKGNNK